MQGNTSHTSRECDRQKRMTQTGGSSSALQTHKPPGSGVGVGGVIAERQESSPQRLQVGFSPLMQRRKCSRATCRPLHGE